MRKPTSPIDLVQARMQHEFYCQALSDSGVDIRWIPGDSELPDSVFVEDQVVVAGGIALITRSGHVSRRAEAAAVAGALAAHKTLRIMVPPACLDGGDVLLVGTTLFVGRSQRTNSEGVAALRDAFEPGGFKVVEVAVRDALHLKCHCSSPAPGVVLLVEEFVDPAPFREVATVLLVPKSEAYAANVLALDGRAMIAGGYPQTAAVLEAQGIPLVTVDVSEIAKADGSLTCMSVFY